MGMLTEVGNQILAGEQRVFLCSANDHASDDVCNAHVNQGDPW